ncbi:hypothetical protein D1815_04725 [Aquimarina sp. AD1]|uniref:DUF6660 family protein n=1 Tax=Aquimarina sp. (strain AD1) TaxID=1714848 RepID=UPI000E4B009F|nr:DUF6660 family protein [Aquimarina sp. AD1]AXT55093.1 hypothetical protein D1815_04725 [Aquimarina sp. AD1]RKN05883.1 hypothetical protein D7035_21210 [Aquimarina sp. AD1]
MRFLTIILSFFLLAMTIAPCSDSFNAEHQDELSIIDKNHNHSDDTDDSCASLCVCTCCGLSITYELIKPFDIEVKSTIISKDDFTDQPEYNFFYLPNIWQPPQFI